MPAPSSFIRSFRSLYAQIILDPVRKTQSKVFGDTFQYLCAPQIMKGSRDARKLGHNPLKSPVMKCSLSSLTNRVVALFN